MIIENIKIYNFGPFYGNHNIQLNNNGSGSGVHIVRGRNGQGKTSLHHAIVWALYGKVDDRKGQEIAISSLLNHMAQRDGIYKFGVHISFSDGLDKWEVIRQTKSKIHKDAKYKEGMTLDIQKNGKLIEGIQAEYAIQRLLPREVSRFYFFDGEMLHDYEELLDDENPSTILKKSIELVLGVPHMKTACDDLLQIQKNYDRERSRLIKELGGKDFEELAEYLQRVNQEIEFQEQTINKIKDDKLKLETDLKSKQSAYAEKKGIQDRIKRKELLLHETEKLELLRKSEYKNIQFLSSRLYKAILIPKAKEIIISLDLKYKDTLGKYDAKQILKRKIEDLKEGISNQRCKLCGKPLNEEALTQLEKDLKNTPGEIEKYGSIPEPNLEFINNKTLLENMIIHTINLQDIADIYTKIDRIDNKLAAFQTELNDIDHLLRGEDTDEPSKLERNIQAMDREIVRLGETIRKENEKLEDKMRERDDLEKELSSINQDELEKLKKYLDNIKQLILIFQEAISEYRAEKRSEVEQIATIIFKQIRSKEDLDHLQINEKFGLSIITKKGTHFNKSEWKSTGEQQLVALALMGALNKCTQIKAPVIMDTPFKSLDKDHIIRVLKYIPNMADQVILLVTDKEFEDEEERAIQEHIKSDFTIIYKNESEGSFIRPTCCEVA